MEGNYEYYDFLLKIGTYLIASISLAITAYQVSKNAKINRANFWLELRKMFKDYDAIHRSLQSDRTWRDAQRNVSVDDKISIVGYMGLFEHAYYMMANNLIDRKTFRNIYSYRVHVIMDSPAIVESTLIKSGRYWKKFRKLAEEFGHNIPEREDKGETIKNVNYPVGWEDTDNSK